MNSKKGFTLIELLAVIVVLGIIALIAVPVVLNTIEQARKGAFRSSVYGLEKAAELYTIKSDYNRDEKLEFICNGKTCETSDGKKLNFKGEIPISGSIIIEKGTIKINYIDNDSYCALGTKEDLRIEKECYQLDTTIADVSIEKSKISSNSILVRVRANDDESGIKRIEYLINDKSKSIEDKKSVQTIDETYLFEDLDKNTEYEIKVKVTNGNDLKTEKTINIKTEKIENPSITYTNIPTTAVDGYIEKQILNVTFNNSNITTPSYYIKTTRRGTSSLNVTESCGNGLEPGNCTNIASTNILNTNTWYKVTENVNVTYSEPSDITDTLYAITYDGRNYSGASTGVISKIKNLVTGISLNRTSATLTNGYTMQLYATITPSNATDKRVTWASSNNGVATVDGNGLVTARGAGTATIIATSSNGITATCNITVVNYVGVPDKAYQAGEIVNYSNNSWYVVSQDNTSVTLITRANVGESKYGNVAWQSSTPYTYLNNDWLNSNPTLRNEINNGAIIIDGEAASYIRLIKQYEVSPAIRNDSGTNFWTMTPSSNQIWYATKDGYTSYNGYNVNNVGSSVCYLGGLYDTVESLYTYNQTKTSVTKYTVAYVSETQTAYSETAEEYTGKCFSKYQHHSGTRSCWSGNCTDYIGGYYAGPTTFGYKCWSCSDGYGGRYGDCNFATGSKYIDVCGDGLSSSRQNYGYDLWEWYDDLHPEYYDRTYAGVSVRKNTTNTGIRAVITVKKSN